MNKLIIALEIAKLHHKIVRELENKISTAMGESISATHGQIICFLMENSHDRELYQRDIELFLGLKRSSISLILTNMQKNKLITREQVDFDARLNKIVLTDKAKELYHQVVVNFDHVEEKIRGEISEEDIALSMKTLNSFIENLHG